jgi:phosphate transport system substrate-binding protein
MKSAFVISVFVVLALILAACGSAATATPPAPTAAPKATVTTAGSGSASLVLKFLSDAYQQKHGDLAFEYLSGSSTSGGAKGVAEKQLDLGAMARPPKDSEKVTGMEYLEFATDKVAVVTSPDLTIPGLTSQQVKDIFLGKITDWSEVGGPKATINVLARDEAETNTGILRKAIFGDGAFAPGAAVLTSEDAMRDALNSTAHAIGFLTNSGIRLGDLKVHPLTIDGHDPADNSGSYPYTRPVGVVYLSSNAAKVQPFLTFVTSPEAQALLSAQGVIPTR